MSWCPDDHQRRSIWGPTIIRASIIQKSSLHIGECMSRLPIAWNAFDPPQRFDQPPHPHPPPSLPIVMSAVHYYCAEAILNRANLIGYLFTYATERIYTFWAGLFFFLHKNTLRFPPCHVTGAAFDRPSQYRTVNIYLCHPARSWICWALIQQIIAIYIYCAGSIQRDGNSFGEALCFFFSVLRVLFLRF